MSAYDPSGCGLFPDSYLEEPTRPCDSGEVDHEAQKRADALHSECLMRKRAEWELAVFGHGTGCRKRMGGVCSCGQDRKSKQEEGR